ncbi:hypothetical protein H1D32_10505 [Anaerobacillus sp. CMMVII]|nr:hypothetical protein [Anaerobacillus sp. CMMVII]MCT8138146.1 hypothetical protein [Anaerobacillus sp. CMMVII]
MKHAQNQKKNNEKPQDNKTSNLVKIKYDIITPEERDPQPKAYDEIEY